MKTNITLQEKLKDLRKDRDLKLVDVSEATGLSTSTLQRFESDEDIRIGYQDLEKLARFYDVSVDYLFGLTDNDEYRNASIDDLHLSDEAIDELQSGKLNNRMLSEIITHPDFADYLVAMEVYVDRTISGSLKLVNSLYTDAVDEIKGRFASEKRDEHLSALKELSIDHDDYLRFRLSQKFDRIAQGIYDKYKNIQQTKTEDEPLPSTGSVVKVFEHVKKRTGSYEQAVLALWSSQLGIDYSEIPVNEKKAVINYLKRSKFMMRQKKTRKRR